MATNTTNYSLVKPAYTDTADIADINGNMDKVDTALQALGKGIAIISNNNTHVAIVSGQYVYIHSHGSLAEGLYIADSNISQNATLSSSNVHAVASSGSLNDLKSSINTLNSKIVRKHVGTYSGSGVNAGSFIDTTFGSMANSGYSIVSVSNIDSNNADANFIAFPLSNTDTSVTIRFVNVGTSTQYLGTVYVDMLFIHT